MQKQNCYLQKLFEAKIWVNMKHPEMSQNHSKTPTLLSKPPKTIPYYFKTRLTQAKKYFQEHYKKGVTC